MRKFSPLLFLPLLASVLQSASFTNGQAARAVVGQDGFTDSYVIPLNTSNVQTAAANILGGASGLAYANGTLYVADSNRLGAYPQNNRVLGFSTTQIPGPQADTSNAIHPSNECWLCGYAPFVVVGQQDYTTTLSGRNNLPSSSSGSLNIPTAVATDGRIFAIADTDNNRVLIWNSLPASQTTPPNVVLGQANFTVFATPQVVNANSLRGPQGVWIQNGKLFVADTQNHRILIWNNIPTQNNQAADLVLGQPNFTTANQPPISTGNPTTAANQLLNPVSVTSDGTHLFVADLGFNRVLIWNRIPTSMDQGADVVIGQPLMTTAVPNWGPALCASNGTNTDGTPAYPDRCEATLNFPRFALSDGVRLFIADGGNDRVLIFNQIPTSNGAKADAVLGQTDFTSDIISSQTQSIASTVIDNTSSVDTTPTPTSLAFDGTNLYVSDPFNRRVLLFTPSDVSLPGDSVVNAASEIVRQEGVVVVSLTSGGAITANDTVTVTIAGKAYTYTVKANDTVDVIAQGLVSAINASGGDPNATAIFSGAGTGSLYLSSKGINLPFDAVSLAASASNTANLTVTASGGYLTAGTAATAAPGMLIEINGANLADQTASIDLSAYTGSLPTTLGGVQVFIDGFPSPLSKVSPTQIVTQVPFSVAGQPYDSRNSTSIYVRTQHSDGSISVSNATAAYVAPANPGLFNTPQSGPRPWPAAGARHQPGNSMAVISIDGSVKAGDTATVTVNGTAYTYTVTASDTLGTIAAGLVNLIKADPNAAVTAYTGGAFTRVVVVAKSAGAAGDGIPVAGSTSSGAQVSVTAYTGTTCCNVTPNTLITPDNPAVAGEVIQMQAAGLGSLSDAAAAAASVAGQPYSGPGNNSASNSVSATMNGATAQVVSAGLVGGSYGTYTVQLIVPSNVPNGNATQVYIAQNAFISNTVTIPVGAAVQVPPPVTPPPPVPPGSGLANAPILINPTNLVFATQLGGSIAANATQTVTISNPSTSNLSLSSVQISGANASSFAITSNTCPASLTPASSCSVSVAYTTPVAGSIRTASLVVSDSAAGSPQTVGLTGVAASQFEILNRMSGKVLDMTGYSTSNGTQVQQYSYMRGVNQKWSLVDVGNGAYAIMNLYSGKVLDVTGYSMSNGAPIQQWDYLGGGNQKWVLTSVGNGYYAITNVLSGKVLDVTGYSLSNGTIIQQWDYLGGDNQKWQITNLQAYEILNLGTNGALDLTQGLSDNGTPIQQWQYLNGSNQQWYLIPVDNTYYQIMNVATGKVLDVIGGSNYNGTNLQEYDYLGYGNQQWALVPVGTGVYSIVNRQSGRVLDVTGASTANGTAIQQYDYYGYSNQQWQLIAVGTPGQ